MKKLLLATLALTVFALPSQAGVLLPSIFAAEFCSLSDRGLSFDDAMSMAAKGSLVDGEPNRVMFQGVEMDEDVLLSYEAIKTTCPEYLY